MLCRWFSVRQLGCIGQSLLLQNNVVQMVFCASIRSYRAVFATTKNNVVQMVFCASIRSYRAVFATTQNNVVQIVLCASIRL